MYLFLTIILVNISIYIFHDSNISFISATKSFFLIFLKSMEQYDVFEIKLINVEDSLYLYKESTFYIHPFDKINQ